MNLCLPHAKRIAGTHARQRLLMVTHRTPFPPDKGERIRSWHLLRRLARDYDVYLASLADSSLAYASWQTLHHHTTDLALVPVTPMGQRLGAVRSALTGGTFTQGAFHNAHLADAIAQWATHHQFDVALAVCSSAAQYVRHLPVPVKVLDLVDVDSRKWADYADHSRGLSRWVYATEARRLAAYERSLAADFHHVLVTTPAEAELYRQIAPQADIVVVPNGVDFDYFTPQIRAHKPVAVFTGVLNYRPNVEGLDWLVREVWPHVRAEVPEATLRIVGRDPSSAVRQLASVEGVELVGPVDDVRPHLADAACSVAPLHIARGIQNKILEAMAMARPVITTIGAAAAIGAASGRQLYAVNHAGSWACLMVKLLTDSVAAGDMGAAARQFVLQNHQWDHCTQRLMQVMGSTGETSRILPMPSHATPLVRAA